MQNCPSCCSPNVIANKLSVPCFQDLKYEVQRLQAAGQPQAATGISLLWGLTHLVNAFSHTSRCSDCGYRHS